MREKRGSTESLKYDFPTEKECQVLLNNKWYRATPRDFRSWGSARRIVYYNNNQPDYEEYNGPVYYWNTNKICKQPTEGGTQYISYMEREAKIRPTERHLL